MSTPAAPCCASTAVLHDAAPRHGRSVPARAEPLLRHPQTGDGIRDQDLQGLSSMYPTRRPAVRIVLSDGLDAGAVGEPS